MLSESGAIQGWCYHGAVVASRGSVGVVGGGGDNLENGCATILLSRKAWKRFCRDSDGQKKTKRARNIDNINYHTNNNFEMGLPLVCRARKKLMLNTGLS